MQATADDALRLIRHWKNETPELQCVFTGKDSGFTFKGHIADVSASTLSVKGPSCEALITLSGVAYEYHDPNNAPIADRESAIKTYVNGLVLVLPSGDRFQMTEIRTVSSPGPTYH